MLIAISDPDARTIYSTCGAPPEYRHFIDVVWQWVDMFLVFFGPFVIIFIGNIIIVAKIIVMYGKRQQQLNVSSKSDNKTMSTTVMLLVVSVAFLLMTSPSAVYFMGMGYKLWSLETEEDMAKVYGAYSLCYILYYLNSTINFFLYCASGSRFRKALTSLCAKGGRYRENTSVTGIFNSRTTVVTTKI
jgi:hypothetical protein